MPKLKTRKAAKKRFKITGTGKVMRGRAGRRHLLEWRPSKKKRSKRGMQVISPTDKKRVKVMMPYG